MKISKLELERFIKAFKEYIQDNEDKHNWLTNREYLSNNGLSPITTTIIEECVVFEATQEQIESVLVALGVEVI